MKSKKKEPFGGLPPRYRCYLNPYSDLRFTKCPRCDKGTYPRKFALVFLFEGGQTPVILGVTCKYCPTCETIIVHKDVVEPFLNQVFHETDPTILEKCYFIVGTVELAYWNKIKDQPPSSEELHAKLADIKEHLHYTYQPAGWYRNDE